MYKKDGYFLRAAVIQYLDRISYQPYHDSCHRMVWKKHTYPIYFYTYQIAYLTHDRLAGMTGAKHPPEPSFPYHFRPPERPRPFLKTEGTG